MSVSKPVFRFILSFPLLALRFYFQFFLFPLILAKRMRKRESLRWALTRRLISPHRLTVLAQKPWSFLTAIQQTAQQLHKNSAYFLPKRSDPLPLLSSSSRRRAYIRRLLMYCRYSSKYRCSLQYWTIAWFSSTCLYYGVHVHFCIV